MRKVEVIDPGDSNFLRGEQSDFWRVVEAVSYTHLDVYKRQRIACTRADAVSGAIETR